MYSTYTVCTAHIRYVQHIYGMYSAYTVCTANIRYVQHIYGMYSTYTVCTAHIRYVQQIYGMYSTYTVCTAHIRYVQHIYGMYSTYNCCEYQYLIALPCLFCLACNFLCSSSSTTNGGKRGGAWANVILVHSQTPLSERLFDTGGGRGLASLSIKGPSRSDP